MSRSQTRNSIKKPLLLRHSILLCTEEVGGIDDNAIVDRSSLILLYWWKGHQVDLIDVKVECRETREQYNISRVVVTRLLTMTFGWKRSTRPNLTSLPLSLSLRPQRNNFACLTCSWRWRWRKNRFGSHCSIEREIFEFSGRCPNFTFHVFIYIFGRLRLITHSSHIFFLRLQTSSECEMRQFHSLTRFAYFSNSSLISLNDFVGRRRDWLIFPFQVGFVLFGNRWMMVDNDVLLGCDLTRSPSGSYAYWNRILSWLGNSRDRRWRKRCQNFDISLIFPSQCFLSLQQ